MRVKFCSVILICIIISVVTSYSHAQEATETPDLEVIRPYFEASNLVPLIGEPFTITAIVELPSGSDLVEFPEFGDQWGVFEVRRRSDLEDRVLDNGWTQFRQTLDVLIWEIGDFDTPETLVGYLPADEAEIFYAPFNTIFVTVPSVLDPDMNRNELRPLKPQISFFEIPLWLIFGVMGAVLISGYFLNRWRIQYLQQKNPPAPPPTPAEIAIHQLRELSAKNQAKPLHPTLIYDRLSYVLREFVVRKFQTASLDLTTREFVRDVRMNAHLDDRLIEFLEAVLEFADEAKFGGITMDADSDKLLADSIKWVMSADQYIGAEAFVQARVV